MQAGSDLHFDHYLHLIQGFCPAVTGMFAFADDCQLIWHNGDNPQQLERVEAQLQSFRNNQHDGVLREINKQLKLEIFNLVNARDEVELTLCLCIDARAQDPLPVSAGDQIERLNEILLIEHQQNIALAGKQDELNHMTDELTRRYEELNLIYKAEDQAMNIYHGRELLRQLVLDTSRFLNVDIIFLYIAGKNIAMHKYKNDNPLFESDKLFEYLRESVYPLVATHQRSIVINHIEEGKHLGLDDCSPYKHVASPVVNAENEVIGLMAIASQNFSIDFSNSDRNLLDVMSKKASKVAQSHFDPLTGLENGNSFELIIKDLLNQSMGLDVNHAIANIDIDRMAVINDVSGRDAGDQLIKRVGQTLAGKVRSRDVVARIGSDKFGVLLENCDLSTARNVMQKIAREVSRIDMQWQGRSHEVSISIGIAPINAHTQSVTALLNAAETARHVSKDRGRNNIHVLDVDDNDLAQRKEQIRWVGRIQSALRDDQFMLYAQLIEPLNPDLDHAHYEILLRLRDDDNSAIAPGRFLPAAERFYLMSSIDYWVINQSFKMLAEYSTSAGKVNFPVSINLSGQTLSDPSGLADFIRDKLRQYRICGSSICFEITESAAISNIDDARRFIEEARGFGCKFSLDDFGTGLSSFAYLKNLQVDYLKIDGSFVTDIVADKVSESMVSAINQVGHAMQLKTVAEFVENDTIKAKLISLGIDFGQGYGLGKPAPLSDILSARVEATSKSA